MQLRQWRLRVVCLTLFSFLLLLSLFAIPFLPRAHADYTVSVSPQQSYQTIEGWGSSMVWWANWAGGLPDSQRQPLMDKLFDPNTGIGLNVLRYNFGADGPGNVCHNAIANGKAGVYTNLPTYEPTQGNYDWSQDANQRWVLQAAQARGARIFEGFVNSPPAWMLNNSCTSGNGAQDNLSSAHYDDYASYMATIAQHFHDAWGMPLRTLEMFNEPSGNWPYNGDQEGMYASAGVQDTMINKLGPLLVNNGESAYSSVSASDEYGLGSGAFKGYDSTAQGYITQYQGHGYGGHNGEGDVYTNVGLLANKRLWMSEWGTGDQGSPMGAALALSNDILQDEQALHPASWVIWQAADNYGGTPYPNAINDVWGLASVDSGGNIIYPSRYYAMGNYSKFIRPGYRMIGNSDGNTLTAYDAGSQTLVIVSTNSSSSDTGVTYDLSQFSSVGSSVTPYRTSTNENLAQLGAIGLSGKTFSSSLPANSITTFVVPNVQFNTVALTEVDDSVQGSGVNQFNYQGDWGHCTCEPNAYGGSNSWSGQTGAAASVRFDGTRIRLFGVTDTNEGIGTVSIDGGPATEVDFYSARRADDQFLWESPQLSAGEHTLTLTVTGRKNPQSSNIWPALDRVEIDNSGLPGTAIGAGGSYSPNNGSGYAQATDGNIATYFDPATSPAWTGLDLGSARNITSVRFYPRSGYASRMLNGVFQGSNSADFSSGVVNLYTIGTTPPDGQWSEATVNDGGSYRYVRYITDPSQWCNVAEIQFYGS